MLHKLDAGYVGHVYQKFLITVWGRGGGGGCGCG